MADGRRKNQKAERRDCWGRDTGRKPHRWLVCKKGQGASCLPSNTDEKAPTSSPGWGQKRLLQTWTPDHNGTVSSRRRRDPGGQASWAAGPEWEMKGPGLRRSLGLINETCLPQGRPLVFSLSTPDKSRMDTRRLRQPLPLKSKFSAWSVDLKGVMISSSDPHGWCSGLAGSKHPRSPKHPRFLPGRRGTQRGW